jgi:hypothetical protein
VAEIFPRFAERGQRRQSDHTSFIAPQAARIFQKSQMQKNCGGGDGQCQNPIQSEPLFF